MNINIPLIDIVLMFSNAVDLVSPQMAHHQKRVAYIAYSIASEMGLSMTEKASIVYASLLHDCGALSEEEKLSASRYDFGVSKMDRYAHGYKGWMLLKDSQYLKASGEIIKFHHVYWEERDSFFLSNYQIPMGSYIVHLADRIDTLIQKDTEILVQREDILKTIKLASNSLFMPQAVDAFTQIAIKECFWLDTISPYIENLIKHIMKDYVTLISNIEAVVPLANIMHQIIDFRSAFTAAHSIGVAESAQLLSIKLGFNKLESRMMYLSGLLHDIGKLSVPIGILEKKGPLNNPEFNIIKKHTYYSYRIMENIPGIESINQWASFHHEKLDGAGYPFAIKGSDLDLGSRIMAVSDVFTALTENRPYRSSLTLENTLGIMEKMALEHHLDSDVVFALRKNMIEINSNRIRVQELALDKNTQLLSRSFFY